MKKYYLTIIGIIYFVQLAKTQDLVWVKKMGGAKGDNGQAITTDESGNVYTLGHFRGTVDFDPNEEIFNLTSNSNDYNDIFISKLDSFGNFVWAKHIGGILDDFGISIAIDAMGNVYTTGSFSETVDFDPGEETFTLTSNIASSMFILKLDNFGNFIWAKKIDGQASVKSIAMDSFYNIYATGSFSGTVDFDPSSESYNKTSINLEDIFILKIDNSGNFVWVKQIGGVSNQYGISIAIDSSGNVITSGYFQGSADFDPGLGTFEMSVGISFRIFISKLDSNGNFIWAKKMGGGSSDYGYSLALDSSDNIYTTGSFQGTSDFDPGEETFNLSSKGSSDIFISKLDTSGNFLWAKQIGGTEADSGYNIAVDIIGNIYTTGLFRNTVDFDPGENVFNLVSNFQEVMFISKLDSSGNFIWAKQIGNLPVGRINSISLDDSENVYLTGYFIGTVDFDLGQGTFNLTSNGNADAFILVLGNNTLGTESSIIDLTNVNIYPNPSKGIFIIDSNIDKKINVEILTINGKQIYKSKFTNNLNSFDLSHLSPGIYFAKVFIDDKLKETKKIIIK